MEAIDIQQIIKRAVAEYVHEQHAQPYIRKITPTLGLVEDNVALPGQPEHRALSLWHRSQEVIRISLVDGTVTLSPGLFNAGLLK